MDKVELTNLVKASSSKPGYAEYLKVREQILPLLSDSLAGKDVLSDYWSEEVAGFDYLFDASPLVIAKLREHCYHITGILSYTYRSHHAHAADRYARKYAMLRSLDRSNLFVPESPMLGGFGFKVDNQLMNLDTLKFYETLIGMDKAGTLDPFRKPGKRPIAIEIGAGWGGFGYQFKTLFPNTCYVIVDLPHTMLISATYLSTLFPNARIYIYDPRTVADFCQRYDQYDFAFLPHYSFDSVPLPTPALAVNMVSFQEMGSVQVRGYVDRLAQLGCENLYSHNRDRSPHNNQLTRVSEIIMERFEAAVVPMLEMAYTHLPDAEGTKEKAQKKPKAEKNKAQPTSGKILRVLQRFFPDGSAPTVASNAPVSDDRKDLHRYRHLHGRLRVTSRQAA